MINHPFKRCMEFLLALLLLALFWWVLVFLWLCASVSTNSNGWFTQKRVGRYGKPFTIFKIKSMVDEGDYCFVTRRTDPRITRFGRFIRAYKLDELPQLINVLFGNMSFVGPRPDVFEAYVNLPPQKKDKLFSVRPGITGPASLFFRDEEKLLSQHPESLEYYSKYVFPKKVQINLEYIDNYTIQRDFKIICQTFLTVLRG